LHHAPQTDIQVVHPFSPDARLRQTRFSAGEAAANVDAVPLAGVSFLTYR
jgi:hypothetical protein